MGLCRGVQCIIDVPLNNLQCAVKAIPVYNDIIEHEQNVPVDG